MLLQSAYSNYIFIMLESHMNKIKLENFKKKIKIWLGKIQKLEAKE
jgi:hypothetical protein